MFALHYTIYLFDRLITQVFIVTMLVLIFQRDYYLTQLKHWVNFCIDELDSIQGK